MFSILEKLKMANNDNIDMEQKIKGNDNVQQQLIVQGDMYLGINKEQVLDMIKCYCFTDKEQIIEIVQETINNIPDGRCQAPNKRIFVPIIQQLSYSLDDEIIKKTYKQLLQSSMDKNKEKIVHPSFINIISQLNSDEVKILNKLPSVVGIPQPLINLRIKINGQKGDGHIQVANFSDIGFGICDHPELIGSYIENLERLKLIEIPPLGTLLDKDVYLPLKNHILIQVVISKNDKAPITHVFDEKFFQLTQFGKSFLDACII